MQGMALLLAIGAATPLIAAETSPRPVSADPADKIVCKTEARTGTRFPTKTCRSRKEWDAIREAALRDGHEMIDRPLTGNSSEH